MFVNLCGLLIFIKRSPFIRCAPGQQAQHTCMLVFVQCFLSVLFYFNFVIGAFKLSYVRYNAHAIQFSVGICSCVIIWISTICMYPLWMYAYLFKYHD